MSLLEGIWTDLSASVNFQSLRLELNQVVLMEVVGRYFRDIQLFKDQNKIGYADRHKSGAFTMHWICQLKPIQLRAGQPESQGEHPEEHEMLANELFAIQAGISCLTSKPDLEKDYSFFSALITRLRERNCPPEFLATQLYLYERLRTAEQRPS